MEEGTTQLKMFIAEHGDKVHFTFAVLFSRDVAKTNQI